MTFSSLIVNETRVFCPIYHFLIAHPFDTRPGMAVSFFSKEIVFIDEATLSEALSFVSGCSQCALTPELRLDYILDALTRNRPPTVFVLPHSAACPQCGHDIDRETFIRVD